MPRDRYVITRPNVSTVPSQPMVHKYSPGHVPPASAFILSTPAGFFSSVEVNTLMEGNLAICILTVFTYLDLVILGIYSGKIIANVHIDLCIRLFIIVCLNFFKNLNFLQMNVG